MSAACEKRAVGLPVRHHQVKGIKMSVVFALLAMICKSAVDLLSNRSMKNNQGRSVHFFYLLQSGAMFLIMAVLTGIGVFPHPGQLAGDPLQHPDRASARSCLTCSTFIPCGARVPQPTSRYTG